METRRTLRAKHRRARRVMVVSSSIAVLGLGLGLALPRSATASGLLLAMAVLSLATVGLSTPAPRAARNVKPRLQALIASTSECALVNVRRWLPSAPVDAEHLDEVIWAFASGGRAGAVEQNDGQALLPARYEAIGIAARCDEGSSERMAPHRVRGDRQPHRGSGLSRTADRVREKIDNTKHVWGLIAVIYAYAALFALVVALDVLGD
jgi:hypothetical protein